MFRGCILTMVLVIAAGLLAGSGCQATDQAAVSQSAVSDSAGASASGLGSQVAEMEKLVARIGEHHRHPFRKPYRDEHDRAMRLLAEKTDALLASLEVGGSESALTGAWDSGATASAEHSVFRDSIRRLNDAAKGHRPTAVAASFAKVKADYQRLGE